MQDLLEIQSWLRSNQLNDKYYIKSAEDSFLKIMVYTLYAKYNNGIGTKALSTFDLNEIKEYITRREKM